MMKQKQGIVSDYEQPAKKFPTIQLVNETCLTPKFDCVNALICHKRYAAPFAKDGSNVS